jgi:hypothetical protein
MYTRENETTNKTEVVVECKVVSLGKGLRTNSNGKNFRLHEVQITEGKLKGSSVTATMYEKAQEANPIAVGDVIQVSLSKGDDGRIYGSIVPFAPLKTVDAAAFEALLGSIPAPVPAAETRTA